MNHPTTTNQQTDPLHPADCTTQEQGADSHTYTQEDSLKDWAACFQIDKEGKLSEYCGKFVIFFDGRVVASGENPAKLREEISEKLGVPENRLIVYFVEPGDYFLLRG